MNFNPSLPVGTVILDEVLHAIAAVLTSHAPERGGLLFGPRGQKLITLFVADNESEHHYATYTPSTAICKRGPEIEHEYGLEYKGVIHSHPGSMDHPSGPDITNARKALGINSHLPYFMMPIVTLGAFEKSDLRPHELLLPGGKLSHYIVPQAAPASGHQLSEERISALTLWGDLRKFAARLPGRPKVARSSMLDIEGVSAAAYLLDSTDGIWMIAAAAGYPFTPPLVIPPAGGPTAVPLAWDLHVPADQRFHAAFAPFMATTVETVVDPTPENEPCKTSIPYRAAKSQRRRRKLLVACCILALSSAVGGLVGSLPFRGNTITRDIYIIPQLTFPKGDEPMFAKLDLIHTPHAVTGFTTPSSIPQPEFPVSAEASMKATTIQNHEPPLPINEEEHRNPTGSTIRLPDWNSFHPFSLEVFRGATGDAEYTLSFEFGPLERMRFPHFKTPFTSPGKKVCQSLEISISPPLGTPRKATTSQKTP